MCTKICALCIFVYVFGCGSKTSAVASVEMCVTRCTHTYLCVYFTRCTHAYLCVYFVPNVVDAVVLEDIQQCVHRPGFSACMRCARVCICVSVGMFLPGFF